MRRKVVLGVGMVRYKILSARLQLDDTLDLCDREHIVQRVSPLRVVDARLRVAMDSLLTEWGLTLKRRQEASIWV